MERIYFDNAATTAPYPAVLAAMTETAQGFYGNPSSLHSEGQAAQKLLSACRAKLAGLLGCAPDELYFTSGGSEADNWAIRGLAKAGAKKGKHHIVTSAFEHHAVLHTVQALEKEGFSVTYLPVHEDGYVRPAELEAALRDETALVTVMYANNEIGTIQPVAELGAICRAYGVPFHTDAVQAVGHLKIDVANENIDLLSLSAHKFHGPKGVGALYVRKGLRFPNLIEGGAQERSRRAGTENLPAIHGMTVALETALADLDKTAPCVRALRDRLIAGALKIERSRLNGGIERRLDGNASICFEGVEGEALLLHLDLAGIAASSGSACTSGSLDPSHVLLALGLPHEIAHGSLRLSLCESNTEAEVDYFLGKLAETVALLRDMSPVWEKLQNESKQEGR